MIFFALPVNENLDLEGKSRLFSKPSTLRATPLLRQASPLARGTCSCSPPRSVFLNFFQKVNFLSPQKFALRASLPIGHGSCKYLDIRRGVGRWGVVAEISGDNEKKEKNSGDKVDQKNSGDNEKK